VRIGTSHPQHGILESACLVMCCAKISEMFSADVISDLLSPCSADKMACVLMM
jgi:hypothetical protein